MTDILVIEPAPAERDRLALCLRRAGHTVRSAESAADALAIAHAWNPAVIVLPLGMPTTGCEHERTGTAGAAGNTDGRAGGAIGAAEHAGDALIGVLRSMPTFGTIGMLALLPPGGDVRAAILAGADDALPAPAAEGALLEAVAARARRSAAGNPAAHAPDAVAIERLAAALAGCARPATVALIALQGAHAIAAVEGAAAVREFEDTWRQRVHALALDAVCVVEAGPGEVLVVLPPSTPQLRALVAAIAGTGQIPVHVGTALYRARAAIGMATVERDAPSQGASTILHRCRFALERARMQAHPQVHTFEEHEAHSELDDLALATLIQQAAEEGRFQLAYLPKVQVPTGAVIGVEALIRWNMPTGESVPPARLLAVADGAGLLDEVGTWALREACRQAARWAQNGLRMPVSVNISAGQFRRGDFVDETRMALSEAGLQGEQLMVEVSERTIARGVDSVRDQLADVRVTGVRVSIEDIGAGALALPTLRSLPLDELKIDQSLVARLPGIAQDRAAVDFVLREAHELGMPCVAEGVEHAAQWAYLAERGWPAAQGWLISRPLAPDAVPAFCTAAAHQARTAAATRGPERLTR